MKYRKRKKGFTLIEMLGVLILLAVIGIITVSGITAMIKGTNNKISDATTLLIEDAITDYISDKSDIYIRSDNATYCINISDLIDNGNLTKQSISSLDESLSVVKVTFKNNKPVYEITDSCTENTVNIKFTLIGDKKINIEVGMGAQYEEQGASAYDDKGNIVSYTRTILDSKGNELINVDTNKIDIYTIRYSANINGETYVIERYVNVRDTTKPIIINDGVDTIYFDLTSFDLLEGITITDNSSEIITPKIKTDLSLGVSGLYTITYIATDSSGNTTTYVRDISIIRKKSTMISQSNGEYYWANTYLENIISIDFVYYIDTKNAIESWDLSVEKDNSIIGWIEEDAYNPSYYKVYVGSENDIMANSNCDSFFAYMDNIYSINFENFDTSNTESMQWMFWNTGYNMMQVLDLGDKFDTSNVYDMGCMFTYTGYNAMTNLNLGDKFDTSNVEDMGQMFHATGFELMASLDLGDNFNTSNVFNMSWMFLETGYMSMTTLNLGNKFDTNNVESMYAMFMLTGCVSMTSLDLGDKFDTTWVSSMVNMFNGAGYGSMTKLDLGDKFNTSNVSEMKNMFFETGYESMTSLNLGDSFDTNSVYDMESMFEGTGYESMTTLDLGPSFKDISSSNVDMFTNTGKSDCTIKVSSAIYNNSNTSLKLNATSTETVSVSPERTIVSAYTS